MKKKLNKASKKSPVQNGRKSAINYQFAIQLFNRSTRTQLQIILIRTQLLQRMFQICKIQSGGQFALNTLRAQYKIACTLSII